MPHAGTWIEIEDILYDVDGIMVVPHAGTWIEIAGAGTVAVANASCPMRARGLKFIIIYNNIYIYSRAPCGHVD